MVFKCLKLRLSSRGMCLTGQSGQVDDAKGALILFWAVNIGPSGHLQSAFQSKFEAK